jgi:IclR family KDG regulon transcriptional repressor
MHAIDKALNILEVVLQNEEGVTLVELAKLTGQNVSTVHRICSRLVNRGYLYQKEKGEQYSLGLKLLQFNNVANSKVNIKEEAYPFLKKLSKEISETVIMSVLEGAEPTRILQIVANKPLLVAPGFSLKSPLHCTSEGKIFLASMPDYKIDYLIQLCGLNAFTKYTITDLKKLKRVINKVRREGVAFDDEEYVKDLRSGAAGIMGEDSKLVATIAFLAPSTSVSSLKMKELGQIVKNYALDISRALGFKQE